MYMTEKELTLYSLQLTDWSCVYFYSTIPYTQLNSLNKIITMHQQY